MILLRKRERDSPTNCCYVVWWPHIFRWWWLVGIVEFWTTVTLFHHFHLICLVSFVLLLPTFTLSDQKVMWLYEYAMDLVVLRNHNLGKLSNSTPWSSVDLPPDGMDMITFPAESVSVRKSPLVRIHATIKGVLCYVYFLHRPGIK